VRDLLDHRGSPVRDLLDHPGPGGAATLTRMGQGSGELQDSDAGDPYADAARGAE